MKILISTENKAKIKAINDVFNIIYDNIEIYGEKFSSNVKEQPLSEEEGILGALNRAKNSKLKYHNYDFYVGMEGFVDTNKYGMFLGGAVCIIDKNGNIGVGISGKIEIPNFIKNEIQNGIELGPLIQKLMSDENNEIRHFDGTNGILTKGLYNRVDEFKDATKCALAKFQSIYLYNK